MSITELSVKRPATIIVFLIVFLGLGYIGYRSMGADLLPSINFPLITVSVSYNGASADEIKKEIVKPIEDAISGIGGIDKIQSSAREGYGQVMVLFNMEKDMNSAFIDIQKAVDGMSAQLPKDATKPVLYKMDPGEMAVLTLTVTGNKPYEELYNEADKIKQKIEKIDGVGRVNIQGGNKKELFVKADKTALEYYGVNINTIVSRLRIENINLPSGLVKEEDSKQSVKVVGEFKNIDEIKNLRIPVKGNGTMRLGELAEVTIQYPPEEQKLRLNGEKTIGITVQKQSDSNVVDIVNKVKKELDRINPLLIKGVKIEVVDDSTVFINSALKEIRNNLLEGILVTAIVLFLFLRSFRASLIVLVAIPTSLISTFFMMYIYHFTLNMMSLMALSLSIGILVDDSIVVLENIQRHLSKGKSRFNAAIDGRKEIGMAAIAITLCDVVVFAPVAFMSGIMGQFFKEFGLTVVFATLFSLLVSFTITPMLASRFLKLSKKETSDDDENFNISKQISTGKISIFMNWATDNYRLFLLWSLRNRGKVITTVIVGIILSIMLIPLGFIKTEYMAQSDQSKFTISVKLSPGTSLEKTDVKIKRIENYLKTIPEVLTYYSNVGNGNDSATGSIIVKLKPKKDRKISQSNMAAKVREWCKNIEGTKITVNEVQNGGGSSNPVQVNIMGPDVLALNEVANKVEGIIKTIPGIIDVNNSTKTNQSEIQVQIDRLAANEYGLTSSDISSVIRSALQGSSAGVFRENGNDYDIMVKFMDNQVKNSQDIGTIKITNQNGIQVSLNQVASIIYTDSQQSISRTDRQDVVSVSANIQGVLLGQVNKEIQDKLSSLKLMEGYSINYGGNQQQMNDSFSALITALVASIVLVYLVLVVLYESFFTPILRLLSLPCAVIGALVIPAITGKSLDMMSMIGLIMLDGLASKNGTLLIDYTNTLMRKGLSLKDALIESGTTRLRPIIMTSVTMIVGMLPAAMSLGEGSEMKSGMAIVIIGGMLSSTILTPIVIPVIYTLFDDIKNHLTKKTDLIEK